jgi:heme-degrading monooxygenase HmoA
MPIHASTDDIKIYSGSIFSMILEVAILDIKPGLEVEFETAFKTASSIIASMPGYCSHELQRCIETTNRYILLVNWETLGNHTVGFRRSPEYQEWRSLLHHFYDPFPVVEHFRTVV